MDKLQQNTEPTSAGNDTAEHTTDEKEGSSNNNIGGDAYSEIMSMLKQKADKIDLDGKADKSELESKADQERVDGLQDEISKLQAENKDIEKRLSDLEGTSL